MCRIVMQPLGTIHRIIEQGSQQGIVWTVRCSIMNIKLPALFDSWKPLSQKPVLIAYCVTDGREISTKPKIVLHDPNHLWLMMQVGTQIKITKQEGIFVNMAGIVTCVCSSDTNLIESLFVSNFIRAFVWAIVLY